jgi:hypothetical protein
MKRLVASRKLKRTCIYCNRSFIRGDVYYKVREVYDIDECGIVACEYLICPRCHYHDNEQRRRYKAFKEKCSHPENFRRTKYRYIPGECVQEPDYDYCDLCGKIV